MEAAKAEKQKAEVQRAKANRLDELADAEKAERVAARQRS